MSDKKTQNRERRSKKSSGSSEGSRSAKTGKYVTQKAGRAAKSFIREYSHRSPAGGDGSIESAAREAAKSRFNAALEEARRGAEALKAEGRERASAYRSAAYEKVDETAKMPAISANALRQPVTAGDLFLILDDVRNLIGSLGNAMDHLRHSRKEEVDNSLQEIEAGFGRLGEALDRLVSIDQERDVYENQISPSMVTDWSSDEAWDAAPPFINPSVSDD